MSSKTDMHIKFVISFLIYSDESSNWMFIPTPDERCSDEYRTNSKNVVF